MSGPWEEFSKPAADDGPWNEFSNGDAKKQNKGIVGDLVTDLKRGVQNLPGTLSGIGDMVVAPVVGDAIVSKGWDLAGKKTGFQPSKWAKEATAEYSDQRKAGNESVEKAWEDNSTPFKDAASGDFSGLGNVAKAYASNPGVIAGSVAESAPAIVLGGAIGKGVGVVSKMSPIASTWIGEGAVAGGQQMASLTEEGVDARTASNASLATSVGVGALGAGGGKIAKRFGLADVDTALAGGAFRGVAKETADATLKGSVKEAAKRIAGGAVSEGVFEELPQSALEQTLSNLAQGKPWDDGIARASVEGTLAGSLMGGAFNAIPGRKPESAPSTDPVVDNKPAIAGLLPSPTYTGTPGGQLVESSAERQAAIDKAQSDSDAIWAARDEYERQQEGYRQRPIPTIITDPEPIQQRINALMGIDEGRLSDKARADYEKAIENAFNEKIGVVVGENSLEIPFTMGDYLQSKVAAADISRDKPKAESANQQAANRLGQLSSEESEQQPDIPVVGTLSRIANLGIQSGAIQRQGVSAMTQQVAPTVAKVQASPVLAETPQIDLRQRTDGQLSYLANNGKPGFREAAIAEIQRRGQTNAAKAQPLAQEATQANDAQAGFEQAAAPKADGVAKTPLSIPPEIVSRVAKRTDKELAFMGKVNRDPVVREAIAQEMAIRSDDQNRINNESPAAAKVQDETASQNKEPIKKQTNLASAIERISELSGESVDAVRAMVDSIVMSRGVDAAIKATGKSLVKLEADHAEAMAKKLSEKPIDMVNAVSQPKTDAAPEAKQDKEPVSKPKSRNKIDPEKDSLFVAVAKAGGMDTDELLSNGIDSNDITYETSAKVKKDGQLGKKRRMPISFGFALPLHKKGGMSFDGMREAMQQYGYMPQDATKNDAIDLFKQELGGDPVYTSRAIELRQEIDQEQFDKMMQEEQDRIDAELAAQEIAEADTGYNDLSEEGQAVFNDFAELAIGDNGKQDDNAIRAGMRALGFTEEEINDELAKNSQAQRESEEIAAGRSQEGGAGRNGNGAQDAQASERGGEKGFDLAGQTNSQAAEQFASQQNGENDEPTKDQADRERDAVPFSLGVQSQPKPQGVQTGLFTADGRVSSEANEKSPANLLKNPQKLDTSPEPVKETAKNEQVEDGAKKQKESSPSEDQTPGSRQYSTMSDIDSAITGIYEGTVSLEDYKAAFNGLTSNKDAITAELGKMTIPQLLERFGKQPYGRPEKKGEIVERAFEAVRNVFALRRSYGRNSYTMGRGEYEKYLADNLKALTELVNSSTADDLKKFADEIGNTRAARQEKIAAAQDPKTIEDFDNALRLKKAEGMTFAEARMSLTPEQRAEYDRLKGIESRDQRKARADQQKTDIRVASQTTDGQVVETKHTKTGEPLFVVKAAERVDRDVYTMWNTTAKRMGGYYSAFRGNGAVPGFQFKTRENADAFLSFIGGNAEAAKEAVQERRDAFADDRSQSAVERLNEMADRLEEKADESLGRERKANTERRARFAASAEAAANAEKAMVKTMRRISEAIGNGTAQFIDRVRQKSQIEYLASVLRTAKDIELRTKYPSYADQEKHKGEPATGETADYAEFPQYAMMRSDLANLARKMVSLPSMKMLGQRILKVADDTSAAYTSFAKEHLLEVSRFGKADGSGWATFSTMKDAERSIEVSNLAAVAVPLQIKRGEYRIVLSPSEAISRGVWKGDDRKVFLSPEVGEEIVEKLGKLNRKYGKRRGMDAPPDAPWQFENTYNNRKRLSGMGIEQPWEFRATLREFANLKEAPKEADKIKAMERAMIGRKNDGLDFFPTPAETAQAMIDAAEITEGMSILEPSAGMGHIAERIRDAGAAPDVIEFNSDRRELLEAKGFNVVGNDFMEAGEQYDRIIMNPPFSNRRDAEHVQHAYSLLKPGGRIVAIMGEGVFFGQDKKAQSFREWLDEVGGTSEKLEDGTFLDPSLPVNTATNARMVVIDKPKGSSDNAVFARAESGNGIPMEDLNAVASGFRTEFPGIPVMAVENESQLPKELRDEIAAADAVGDVAGAYHEGQIYLIKSGIRDIEHARHTVVHEGVHGGLKRIGVPDEVLLDIAKSNERVDAEARRIQSAYQYSYVRSVEEAMADLGQSAQSLKGWGKLRAWMRGKLRKLGIVNEWTDSDVDYLLTKALGSLKTPAATTFYRGTAFSKNGQTQFSADGDVKISPADKAIYGMATEGRSAADILKFIASASRSPFNRQVAKLLLKTGINPTITVDDGKGWKMNAGDGHKYAAAYNPGTDTVALFRPASAERHALHELIHAATIKALSKKGLAAVQMRALFAHVQKNGKAVGLFYDQKTKRGIYGMADIDEFIAEAFSNPKFQALLKQVSAPKTPGSTLSSAWHWFSRIVRGILGLPMNTESALSRALDIGVGVMRENMKINEVISDGITRPSTDRSNPFSRIDEIAKVFERRVGEALSGGRVTGPILVADNTPASMQAFGWADRKVVINLKELQKIAAKPGFETDKAIASIVHDLRRPALMFWNTKNKSINYLRPGKMNMMIGVAPDAEMRNDKDAHLVLTAHLLDRADEQALRNKIERGELVLIYKGREVLGISGLAEKKLPQFNGLLAHGLLHARAADTEAKFKILRESDLVKWEADNWGNGIRYNVADEGWSVSEPSKMDDVIYSLQDKHIDMKRVVQSIFKTGKKVRDEVNAYLQEELFHGRAAKGVKDFLDFELRPLLQEMMRNKIDMGDFEEYLWNAHAQERNEQIAKVNPEMNDGGSGIKTADAKAYLSGISAERKQIFESLAAKVDAMNRNSQKVLVESGLEKQETIDAWNGAYKHYVPLQREDVDSGHIGTGKGFSIRGSSTKRAMGSGRNVVDIIANLTMQRERNIVRAEKNRVSNALMGLAVENPNDDFWTVDKAPTERVVEETAIYTVKDVSGEKLEEFTRMSEAERFAKQHPGSEIEQSWGDRVKERIMPGFKSRDNVLLTRVNGEDHYVIFNERDERAMRMALAMKNLDADNLGRVLSVVGKATRYLASINTQFNPVFGVINLIRDTQGALINLSSTPIAGDQKKVLGYTKDALIGIYKDIRAHRAGKKPSSDWAELFEEFQNEGGQTGYRDQYANAEQRAEAIQSELKQFKEGGAKRLVRGVFGWLSDYNETMENAVRLATYKAAKERGISKQQAASVAKSITVNFNRKGQVATQVGALYAFFNASVQGSARLAQTLFEQSDGDAKTIRLSKTGKKILAGGIMLGSMQALLLAAAGFDDDEPPEFIRERNLILPIGDGKYLTLAMPLGFHVIPGIGRIATEFVLAGGKDPIKRMASLFSMFAESFNPVGNAGFSLQTIAPSVVDPFAALAENKDFTGKEIYRENFNALNPTPGHARAKDVASVWSRYISEALNFITGGSEFRPGVFSPSPDAIDYLIGQATGGVGRELTKAGTTIGSAFTGEDLPMYKIPLVGRFVGDTEGQSGQSAKFYDAIKQINMHEAEYKGLISGGRSQEASDYLAENPAVKLIMLGNQTERVVRNLRSKKREMIDSEASQDSIKAIDERITETMARFNERVERVI